MGKFENDMEQKLGNFYIEPSAQVWEGVEAALHEKKKRRLAIWWWVPVAGLLLLGFGWWMMAGEHASTQKVTALQNKVDTKGKDLAKKTKEEKDGLVEKKKDDDKVNPQQKIDIEAKEPNGRKKFHISSQQNSELQVQTIRKKSKDSITFQSKQFLDNGSVETAIGYKKENNKTFIQLSSGTDSVDTKKLLIGTRKQADTLAKKDSLKIASIKKEMATVNDSSEARKILKTAFTKNKKHQWSFVTGGGISLVRNNNLISTSYEKALDNIGSATSGSTAGSQFSSRTDNSKKLPNTGSFFLIGANYQRNLSKHWDGNIGLQYRYIRNKQVEDSTGKIIANKANWLELPVNMQYTINPASNIKFQLMVGASVAYSFYKKWLVVPATGNLYYDDAQNHGFIFNLNAAISMQMKSGYKLTLMGEQSLTPIHKNNNYKYYWRQWGVQINMPINLSRK